MAIIGTQDYTLEKLLSNGPYHIPIYQRGYSWTKSELEEFFEDYKSIIENESDSLSTHFLGQIVLHLEGLNENSKLYIIDGQQRITTGVIFFSALREIASSFVDKIANMPDFEYKQDLIDALKETITFINANAIGTYSRVRSTIKLFLIQSTHEFFYEYVINFNKTYDERASYRKNVNKSDLSTSKKKHQECFRFFYSRTQIIN